MIGTVNGLSATYGEKRNLLALLPVFPTVSYHLFRVQADGSMSLLRKASWFPDYQGDPIHLLFFSDSHVVADYITDMDIDASCSLMATNNFHGCLIISSIDTNEYKLSLELGGRTRNNKLSR
mgnify:FL=1